MFKKPKSDASKFHMIS
jgi:hypothetical protein